MKYIFASLLSMLVPFAASAAVFIQSVTIHPYTEQLTNCKVTIDVEAPVDVAPVDVGTGHRCRLDVTARQDTGGHDASYQACNVWGCGGVSTPTPFNTSVPPQGGAMQLSN